MADKSKILSADAEAALLKPIDEYVGKIQSQIDALRVDGSDKVQSYKNQIAIAKEDKNLSKDERAKAVAAAKSGLEKAKSVEAANKDKVSKLIAEAEKYLSENYNSKYYDKVVASCEAEKAAEKHKYCRQKRKRYKNSVAHILSFSLCKQIRRGGIHRPRRSFYWITFFCGTPQNSMLPPPISPPSSRVRVLQPQMRRS